MRHLADLIELRKLAEKATKGPWTDGNKALFTQVSGQDRPWNGTVFTGGEVLLALTFSSTAEGSAAVARYIAACHPQTILALLDEIERLRALADLIDTDTLSEASK